MANLTIHPRTVYVYFDTPFEGNNDHLYGLNAGEIRRSKRFHRESDRRLFLTSRALVRKSLSRHLSLDPTVWEFRTDAHGRPSVAFPKTGRKLRFSVSHTDELAMCAIAFDIDVGADVELLREYPRDILNCFTLAEAEAICMSADRSAKFFEYWTLKEAYLKARGLGLSIPLNAFSFRLGNERPPHLEINPLLDHRALDWCFHTLRPTSRHVAALCVFSPMRAMVKNARIAMPGAPEVDVQLNVAMAA